MIDFTQEEKEFFMREALKEAEKSLQKRRNPHWVCYCSQRQDNWTRA